MLEEQDQSIVPQIDRKEELKNVDSYPAPNEKDKARKSRSRKRSVEKPITSCPHTSRKQYAKGMCNPCYYAFGKNQSLTATNCAHEDRVAYALGKCCSCYQRSKLIEKRNKKSNSKKEKDILELFSNNEDLQNSSLFDLLKNRDCN